MFSLILFWRYLSQEPLGHDAQLALAQDESGRGGLVQVEPVAVLVRDGRFEFSHFTHAGDFSGVVDSSEAAPACSSGTNL